MLESEGALKYIKRQSPPKRGHVVRACADQTTGGGGGGGDEGGAMGEDGGFESIGFGEPLAAKSTLFAARSSLKRGIGPTANFDAADDAPASGTLSVDVLLWGEVALASGRGEAGRITPAALVLALVLAAGAGFGVGLCTAIQLSANTHNTTPLSVAAGRRRRKEARKQRVRLTHACQPDTCFGPERRRFGVQPKRALWVGRSASAVLMAVREQALGFGLRQRLLRLIHRFVELAQRLIVLHATAQTEQQSTAQIHPALGVIFGFNQLFGEFIGLFQVLPAHSGPPFAVRQDQRVQRG
jgi:hypothetical protein